MIRFIKRKIQAFAIRQFDYLKLISYIRYLKTTKR